MANSYYYYYFINKEIRDSQGKVATQNLQISAFVHMSRKANVFRLKGASIK